MEIVIGVILLIAAVFLIVAVLMQNGKSHNMSGVITGGAETFFGKTKGNTMDKMLNKLTTVVAIVFCVLVVIMYVFQDDTDLSSIISTTEPNAVEDTTAVDDTAVEDTSAADTSAAE
ncbi:MAG: preprotein translocase subunit SecG [Clostridia bacterium]|nr:preprotein translocase subunit SecG [Clostridia bacterium]